MLACRILGHRFRFRAEGPLMLWECVRECGAGGSKRYATDEDARRYALGLERDAAPDRGPPLIAALPVRLLRRVRGRRR
ncbi:MAG TPA: hypothetical protein VGK92_07430 [Gaiellales bacterium]|jgi:hypothetical protein